MSRIKRVLLGLVLLLIAACAGVRGPQIELESAKGHGPGGAFVPGCMPFPNPGEKQDIDKKCPKEGNAGSDQALAEEYSSKNFLCAHGTPIDVGFDAFHLMQEVVDENELHYGNGTKSLPDRSAVKDLVTVGDQSVGEGTLVRLVGYVRDVTHTYEKPGAKEGVNCEYELIDNNDIHINIGRSPKSKPCNGVVAEMIPHFRNANWTPDHVRGLIGGKPVRVTGHVFFDSRHSLFTCQETDGNPKRMSLFEIHPVYRFEVCRHVKLNECDASDDAAWQNLESLF